jgi:membrane protease YdiL (CAAX protease family)
VIGVVMKKTHFGALLLIFVLLTFFSFLDYQFFITENRKGKNSGAYFIEARYPPISYQGEKTLLNLTMFNKNCTVDDANYGYFFLLFYLDGEPWLNEFNDTDYKSWRCDMGSSVTRYYVISSWETIKPVIHNVSIELYWFYENTSYLQDTTSFSMLVAVYAEPTNLLVLSYQATYLIVILFIGFYMMLEQPIRISLKTYTNVSGKQPSKLAAPPFKNFFFLFFYLLILALQYLINWLLYLFSIAEPLRQYVYVIVQFFNFLLLILAIKKEKLNLKKYGFFWPRKAHKYVLVSLMLALIYSFMVIFVPGIFKGYYIYPNLNLVATILGVIQAIVVSLTSGAIFYGYFQSMLRRIFNSSLALVLVAMLFAFYTLPSSKFDLFEVASFFILGLFLGFLRYRTRTLLSTAVFYFACLTLMLITPIKGIASEQVALSSEFIAFGLSSILLLLLVERRKVLVPISST